jgi:2-haloacid dehalogenase
MRPTLIFDVTGTLLDPGGLDEYFVRGFGDAEARRAWERVLLELALTVTVTDRHRRFDELAFAALRSVEIERGVELDDRTRGAILVGMRALPPFPEVGEALTRLRDADVALHALSNETLAIAEEQLVRAGLFELFTSVQAAGESEMYKPKVQVYRTALTFIGARLEHAMLVSAHGWDVAGALAFGMRAAFVARPGCLLDPQGPQPHLIAPDLTTVAERLLFFPVTTLGSA